MSGTEQPLPKLSFRPKSERSDAEWRNPLSPASDSIFDGRTIVDKLEIDDDSLKGRGFSRAASWTKMSRKTYQPTNKNAASVGSEIKEAGRQKLQ